MHVSSCLVSPCPALPCSAHYCPLLSFLLSCLLSCPAPLFTVLPRPALSSPPALPRYISGETASTDRLLCGTKRRPLADVSDLITAISCGPRRRWHQRARVIRSQAASRNRGSSASGGVNRRGRAEGSRVATEAAARAVALAVEEGRRGRE